MEYIVKLLTTFGIIAGAVDLLFLKGKWKLDEKFQQGFEMIGSMMLSMTGILMLAPAAASLLEQPPCPDLIRLHYHRNDPVRGKDGPSDGSPCIGNAYSGDCGNRTWRS